MSKRPTFEEARRRYTNRFTMEHVPEWAKKPHRGQYYAPQYASDREWYDNTTFPGEKGHQGTLNECYSANPTFPLGRWLAAPHQPQA